MWVSRFAFCERTNANPFLRSTCHGEETEQPEEQNRERSRHKAQPVEEVRIGSVKAAIWRNDTETGPRFNVTLQRIYRTEDGKWHSTPSFGRDDLLVLVKVANEAHTHVMQLIGEQREQERDQQRQREQPTA